jgi:hypothetical protein
MNPERLPTSAAGKSSKVSVRLTRDELLELDRSCEDNDLTSSEVARRALNAHLLKLALGREE